MLSSFIQLCPPSAKEVCPAVDFFGDWNINLPKQNGQVSDFLILIYTCSILASTKPTRVANNTPTLIDHSWFNLAELNVENYIIYNDIFEHF